MSVSVPISRVHMQLHIARDLASVTQHHARSPKIRTAESIPFSRMHHAHGHTLRRHGPLTFKIPAPPDFLQQQF